MHRLPSDTQEQEADAFAAELLAPAAEIAPQLAGLTTRDLPRLLQLKAEWGISVAALIRRAKDLEIISDRQYREFQVKLGRLGWRTLEPGTLTPETPATLSKVIGVHRRDHQYSDSELAAAAVMTDQAFRKHYLSGDRAEQRPTPLRLVP
jgi:Zn-dependent peptidase ImmA (M78 family)